jgi:hypothetical protein
MVSHALAAPGRNAFRINAQATFHVCGIKANVHQSLQGMLDLQDAQEKQQELCRDSS